MVAIMRLFVVEVIILAIIVVVAAAVVETLSNEDGDADRKKR